MSQPEWKFIVNMGDADPITYGGLFLFEDTTGVYDPELERLESPEESEKRWMVYRICLEKCTYIDGVLSDNSFHPDHSAWFADDLESVSSSMDYDIDKLRSDLCSDDSRQRAEAYRAIAEYHGWYNFDEYPLTLTKKEAKERYKDIIK